VLGLPELLPEPLLDGPVPELLPELPALLDPLPELVPLFVVSEPEPLLAAPELDDTNPELVPPAPEPDELLPPKPWDSGVEAWLHEINPTAAPVKAQPSVVPTL
jgi:hypothetical protein